MKQLVIELNILATEFDDEETAATAFISVQGDCDIYNPVGRYLYLNDLPSNFGISTYTLYKENQNET